MKKYIFLGFCTLAAAQSSLALDWGNLGRAAQNACKKVGEAAAEFCQVASTELGRAIATLDEQKVRRALANGGEVTKAHVDYAVSLGADGIARILREARN
jgi:hypothetical protein